MWSKRILVLAVLLIAGWVCAFARTERRAPGPLGYDGKEIAARSPDTILNLTVRSVPGWPSEGSVVELYDFDDDLLQIRRQVVGTLVRLERAPDGRAGSLRAQVDVATPHESVSDAHPYWVCQVLPNGRRAVAVPWAHGDTPGRPVVLYSYGWGEARGTISYTLPNGYAVVEVAAADVLPAMVPSAVAPQ